MHSSGAFTISAEKAQEKLGKYSLVHPSLYVLQLVSVAVRGNAKQFQAESRDGDSLFRFDGEPLTQHDLESVMGQLFESFTSRRLRDLAIALTAAHSIAEQDIVLAVSDGTYRFDGKACHKCSEESSPKFSRLTVPGKFQFLGKFFKREANLKETLSLCSYAPMDFKVNGQTLSNSFYPYRGYTTASTLEWKNQAYPLQSGTGRRKLRLEIPCPHNFGALLYLMPGQGASETGLKVVLAGVPYSVEQKALINPCVCAVVQIKALQTDLSCANIVKNQDFKEMVERLNQQIPRLIHETVTGPDRFRKTTRTVFEGVHHQFQRIRSQGESSPHWHQLCDYQRWIDAYSAFSTHEEDSKKLAKAADRTLGSPEAAEDLRILAVESILEQFQERDYSRDLRELMGLTDQLRWLLEELPRQPRLDAIRDFLTMCEPGAKLEKEPQDTARVAYLRVRGETQEALRLSEGLYFPSRVNDLRPAVDLCFAVGEYDRALELLLKAVHAKSLDEALTDTFDFYRLELDLIADCLEYQGAPRSLEFRERAFELTYSEDLKYLRCLEIARQARGSAGLASWVRYQARVGLLWMGEARHFWDKLNRRVRRGRDIVQGKYPLPDDLDNFVLPLKDAFGHYQKLYPYLLTRIAHRLRLAGRAEEAERLLARASTINEMDRLLEEL